MSRAPKVLAGTIAGIAGVLAFPMSHRPLTIASPTTNAKSNSSGSSSSSGTSNSSTSSSSSSGAAAGSTQVTSATGTDEAFRYGDIAVKVTIKGSKITAVTMASQNETDSRSQEIDSYAIPQLESQVLAANSANIQGVSGATFTSQAFYDSVVSALSQLGFK